MSILSKRATIYFDPAIHKALKLLAIESSRSISDIIDEAVRLELAEEEEDLRDFEKRINEPAISFDSFVKELKANGKL